LVFILGIGVLMIELGNLVLCCSGRDIRSKATINRANEKMGGVFIGNVFGGSDNQA
jgi:hypothetical protein